MASNPQVPQFTGIVNTGKFLEPLNGLRDIRSYLDLFPDSLYGKGVDSHFVRFMYTVLGPAGAGRLVQQLLAQRLSLESTGPILSDLDSLYGNSFNFPRSAVESYDADVTGLLTSAQWAEIRAQDESYRSRAIMFLNAVRLGTSPEGMRLAATSGLGMEVDIYENYKYLFDIHSDDPLGLPRLGQTFDLNEFIVMPRPTTSQTQVFTVDTTALHGSWYIYFNGYTTPPLLSPDAAGVQAALAELPSVAGNVQVIGGPLVFIINFTGPLSNQVLPPLTAYYLDGQGLQVALPTTVTVGAIPPNQETLFFPPAGQYAMQYALDQLRPVASYPTFQSGRGWLAPQPYSSVLAETQLHTVTRYVTGATSISWPSVDNTHWIEASVENEAPTLYTNLSQSYTGFHNIQAITAYRDTALEDPLYLTNRAVLANYNSVHVGPFPEMREVMGWFDQFSLNYGQVFGADRALAAYTEPLFVTDTTASGVAIINEMYPADYLSLQGVPTLKYRDQACWSSLERASGAEILEIDLGAPQAVNFISFEITRKPVDIEVDYDLLDQSPARAFVPVVPEYGFPPSNALFYDASNANPWEELVLHFDDGIGMIYTRFLRLVFTRRADPGFLYNAADDTTTPWSVDVRNLRVGRNISPSVT